MRLAAASFEMLRIASLTDRLLPVRTGQVEWPIALVETETDGLEAALIDDSSASDRSRIGDWLRNPAYVPFLV